MIEYSNDQYRPDQVFILTPDFFLVVFSFVFYLQSGEGLLLRSSNLETVRRSIS